MFNCTEDDLKLMLLIRNFELTLLENYSKGLIKGTAHTCVGQEYIPVSMKDFIQKDDFVISNHRGHGHYLAMSKDVEGLLCEIMGREGAVCNGIGGSQHVLAANFLSTGVQAEGIAAATGVAWAMKQDKTKNICVSYIGDGTFGRGPVYESLNMASLYKVPLVVVVENNGIALSTLTQTSLAGTIEARCKAFDVQYVKILSQEPGAIKEVVGQLIQEVRDGKGPLVIEFVTQRVASHSKSDDTRTPEQLAQVKGKYWHNKLKAEEEEYVTRLESEVKDDLARRVEDILQRTVTEWSDYSEGINS